MTSITRPDWRTYFLNIARAVAQRATCSRAQVGAVIVRDNRILATGYNGSLPGGHHCLDYGCDMKDGHCIRAIHAEVNAVAHAAKYGVALNNSVVYVWDSMRRVAVCSHCYQVTTAAGVKFRFLGGPQ